MATKRGGLAALQRDPGKAPVIPPAPPPSPGPAAAPAQEARAEHQAAKSRTPDPGTTEVRSTEVRTPELPKYKQLERKDVLLWPDQLGELSVTRRRLNRQRSGTGERITENTLIRVGVALLLSRAAELAGTTEDELRRSLGLT